MVPALAQGREEVSALPEAEGQVSDPLIRCIMPTCNRETLARRAIASFKAQSYGRAQLLILNSGGSWRNFDLDERCVEICAQLERKTVGNLRNLAIEYGQYGGIPDYIAHFDDDDWSAPDRLSIQLAYIQKTGKLVTGFNDMTMYDTKRDKSYVYRHEDPRYALGTSLFYRREAWERVKFPDKTPEDNKWRKDVGLDNCQSMSSLRPDGSPIMIQTVHGGNASARIIQSSKRFKEASEEQAEAVRAILA